MADQVNRPTENGGTPARPVKRTRVYRQLSVYEAPQEEHGPDHKKAPKKQSAPSAFDILNAEFSQQDEEEQNRADVERMRQLHAARQKIAAAGQTESGESEQEKGIGCIGYGFRILLIAFLAAALAWVIFMPSGSIDELWNYIRTELHEKTTRVAELAGWESGGVSLVKHVASDDGDTPDAQTSENTDDRETSAVSEAATTAAATTAAVQTTTAAARKTTANQKTTTTAGNDAGQKDTTDQNAAVPENAPHIVAYLKSQITVVYDPSGNIMKAFICSTGKETTPTRTGEYTIRAKYRWRLMIGNCYTQYASSFSSSYLLHSIPYNKKNAGTMSNASYDKLGSPASSGCIRLCFRDSKWIYDNCPIGTKVTVLDDIAPVGVVGEAVPARIDDAAHSGWDPTDDAPENPYRQ